jgi:hypothetical protein
MKRMISRLIAFTLTPFVVAVSCAEGAEYYAATNGAGSPGTSWATAFTNLQAALNAATSSGDIIYVAGHTFGVTGVVKWTVSGITIRGGYEGVGTPGNNDPSRWQTVIRPFDSYSHRMRALSVSGLTSGTLEQVTFTHPGLLWLGWWRA